MVDDGDRRLHHLIVRLYERVEQAKIYYRDREQVSVRLSSPDMDAQRPAVDRDMTVCAMLNKAANTKRAVLVLSDAGLADDAYALSRVLMENVVNLAWILSEDWVDRLDKYLLFFTASQCRLEQVVKEHLPDSPLVAEADAGITPVARYIFETVFQNDHLVWSWRDTTNGKRQPLRMRDRLVELEESKSSNLKTGPTTYAISYFHSSEQVHALPASLKATMVELEKAARVYVLRERKRDEQARIALAMSNIWMLYGLSVFDHWVGGGLEPEIAALWKQLQA